MRSLVLSLALLCCIAVKLSAQSFTIDAGPDTQTTTEATSTWTVMATPIGGFSAPIYFRAKPIGMAATWKFTPDVLKSPYSGSVTMTITYTGLKDGSTYQIEVEGYNGIASARDTVSVTVPNKSAWRSYSLYEPPYNSPTVGNRIVLDDAGNCWFSSRGGVVRLTGTTPTRFESISPKVRAITPLAADSGVWISTEINDKYDAAIARYDGAIWTRYDSSTGVPDSITGGKIASETGETAAIIRDGNLWVWTLKALLHHDGTTWTRYPNPIGIGPWMVMDSAGGLWMEGYREDASEMFLVNFDGSFWHEYAIGDIGFPLQSYGRYLLLGVDPDNRIWTTHASPNTIRTFDIGTKTSTEFTNDDGTGKVRKDVNCVAWDAAGNVWIGHGKSYNFSNRNTPGGVHRWDGTQWWHYTKENSGLLDDNVYDIEIDKATNTVWILTEKGIAILDGNAPPSSTIIAGVHERIVAEHASRHLVSVYPNPAANSATLELDLTTSTHVRLSIVDALGRLIAEPTDPRLEAGRQHVSIDLSGVPPGACFVRAIIGDRVESLPLTVVR